MYLMYGIVESESGTILMEQSVIQTHVFSLFFHLKQKGYQILQDHIVIYVGSSNKK